MIHQAGDGKPVPYGIIVRCTINADLQYMQNNQNYDMHCQQDGDADGELGVEGLVAEEPHGQHTAQAAADGTEA